MSDESREAFFFNSIRHDPDMRKSLLTFLGRFRAQYVERMVSAKEPTETLRLQGSIRALDTLTGFCIDQFKTEVDNGRRSNHASSGPDEAA